MVEAALVASDIDSGKQVLTALDADDVDVRLALWWYDTDSGEWRLLLGLPVVDRSGAEVGYKLVQRTLTKHHIELPLRRIEVEGIHSPRTVSIRRLVRTPSNATSNISISASRVGRVPIEGALIYRST